MHDPRFPNWINREPRSTKLGPHCNRCARPPCLASGVFLAFCSCKMRPWHVALRRTPKCVGTHRPELPGQLSQVRYVGVS
jgi:hypothetical protein